MFEKISINNNAKTNRSRPYGNEYHIFLINKSQ